ncbi:VOC family protein [Frigidibacter sp. RF13]|uniref:VOC family protein n=1 Tax=Frigidibacter sp. RF13 TaxID=2997340 RepID=UPI00226D8076|nr:VOC family protein [Frigidibacter sp. RF13]MCY1126342.1 VOC family protein [Frigidibacter sp. RF13]
MIGYVTLGADDMGAAERFYSAFLPRLGYELAMSAEGLSCSLPGGPDDRQAPVDIYVRHPFDGQGASVGNGTMVAFRVETQALVRYLHTAALAAGGRNEGAPGFRAAYGPHFYVAYLRDPQGNKIALYCNSRDEPPRPD